MKSELLITLQERGFINQVTNLDGLDECASSQSIAGYIGFDLTANSLHIGSLIQIMVLRWMKHFKHNPIVLFGESTTKIGDPSGKSSQRPMLSHEQIEENRIGIARIVDRLIGHCHHVSNAEWFNENSPTFMDFLSEFGPHFTINRMLTFESVKSRLERKEPLTFLEFNYMLMQSIDFLKLFRSRDCTLQIGGSDQWGNITSGVDLVRRMDQREVFGLTTPLMTNSLGEKMGKTVSGAIWLDPDKTSAFEFWQFWRNVEDSKVDEFLRLFTELPLESIDQMVMFGDINDAKKILATEVTAMVHGRATAEHSALLAANGKIENALGAITVHTINNDVFEEGGITLAQLLFDSKLVSSKTEADKLAANGGVKVNGNKVTETRTHLPREIFAGKTFLLSVGKNKIISVRLSGE